MTAGSSVVKITAKTALKDNWLRCIAAGMVFIVSAMAVSLIAQLLYHSAGTVCYFAAFILLSVFILDPLFIGTLRYFWRMLFGVKDSVSSVFNYFSSRSDYLRALKLTVGMFVRFGLTVVVLNIPYYLVQLVSSSWFYDWFDMARPIWTANLQPLAMILRIVASVGVFFTMIRYYAAPMLFVADDNINVAEAFHTSSVISKVGAIDFVYLCFSFLGWIILSVFVFPLMFTFPYMITAYLVHTRFAVAQYNKHIEQSDSAADTFAEGF